MGLAGDDAERGADVVGPPHSRRRRPGADARRTSASDLTGCISAPFAALIEWVWLGTTLSVAQMLWGLLTVGGVGLALMPGEHLHRTRRDLFVGTLAAVLASVCGAAGGVLSRRAYEVAHAAGEHLDRSEEH